MVGLLPEAYSLWERSKCEEETREEVEGFQETVKKMLKRMVKLW